MILKKENCKKEGSNPGDPRVVSVAYPTAASTRFTTRVMLAR